ncbi:MAG: beta-lactamase family protein [Polyangiaceae bacterium]|nr:beta-lactamase family protein [Polyangiaceae bacterium]
MCKRVAHSIDAADGPRYRELRMRLVHLTLLLTATSCSSPTQNARAPFSAQGVKQSTTASAFVGATKQGTYAAGTEAFGESKSADMETVFAIGSLSKTLTAILMYDAIQDELASLELQVADVLPELEHRFAETTVEECLRHQSLIPDYVAAVNEELNSPSTEEVLSWIAAQPPLATRGYSNSNYLILGLLLESLRGEPWEKLVHERAQGFGMGATSVCSSNDSGRARGYTRVDPNAPLPARRLTPDASYAAGAICSTVRDWTVFLKKLQEDAELLEWLRVDDRTPYGRGPEHFRIAGRTYWGHSGKVSGFSAFWGQQSGDEAWFVAFMNSDSADIRAIAEHMLDE